MAAMLCLCTAAGVEATGPLRPITLESQALASLVTRIAEAARQPHVRAAAHTDHVRLRHIAPLPPAARGVTHATVPHLAPLLDALHNRPPPVA